MGNALAKVKQNIKGLLHIVYEPADLELVPIKSEEGAYSGKGKGDSLGNLWNKLAPHIKNKENIFKRYSELRSVHLVESILEKVQNDILNKGRSQGEPLFKAIYKADSKDEKKIEEICNQVLINFSIEDNLKEIIFDFLLFGEYAFHIDYKNNELDDRYNYNDILATYARGKIAQTFLISKSDNNQLSKSRGKLISINKSKDDASVDKSSLFICSLPGTRIKLSVIDESGTVYYVRIPTPFISPFALELLNVLLLLEKLIPLSQLMKLDKGQMVTAPVPPGTPIDQLFSIVKEYETRLNSTNGSLSGLETLTLDDLLQHFGKYKVIPVMSGEKGTAEVRELPQPQDIQMENFEYVIRALSSRLNIPTHYIVNGMADTDSKVILQYLNRIQGIREGLENSVKRFLIGYFEHRTSTGDSVLSINPKNLTVKMPEVPGTESLEAVDYMDSISGTLDNVNRIITDYTTILSSEENITIIDKERLVSLLNSKVSPIIGGPVFKFTKQEAAVPPEGGDAEDDWSKEQ